MYRNRNWGKIAAAFGTGLFVACLFPEKLIVFILAALLICLGLFLSKPC